MPKGPRGERRPAGVIENAVRVMQIATGQVGDESSPTVPARATGGKVGGPARSKALTPEKRREIAKNAASARWRRNEN